MPLTPFQRRARESLRSTRFFAALDERQFEAVSRKRLDGGQVLLHKGDESEALYAIVCGRLKVFVSSPDGRDVTFAFLGPGELLGELGVADGVPRSASVLAQVPSELACLEEPHLGRLLRNHPPLAAELTRVSTATVRRLSERAEDSVFLSLESRLAKTLADLAERLGEPVAGGTRLALRQQDLADLMSVSRESINKILSAWKSAGALDLRRGSILIHQLPLH